jgi:succinoglycan biosynthesis protein ExoM
MSNDIKHISVCICTYKRPELLQRLLQELSTQETEGLLSFSIVVADNDQLESARPVVADFGASSNIPIKYCLETRQNIALARNKTIENATGDFVAFIDDDEFPAQGWLLNLFKTCEQYGVDGVLGPVKRHFDVKPPNWVLKGDFYERPTHPTGYVIEWSGGRTGNLLLKMQLFADGEPPFRPEFRAGEDQDFFRRKIGMGKVFVWCNEAVAYEVVPPSRWNRTIMLKRALLRGATTVLHPTFGPREIAKSLVAVPLYIVALPFAFLWGRHHFMKLLVSLFDHLGALLAMVGMNPVKEQYVTE